MTLIFLNLFKKPELQNRATRCDVTQRVSNSKKLNYFNFSELARVTSMGDVDGWRHNAVFRTSTFHSSFLIQLFI